MSIFKQVWAWVRKLPVARYVRPLWTGALKLAVQEAGDALQAEVRGRIDQPEDAALRYVNERFDGWQAGLIKAIRALPLPTGVEYRLSGHITSDGDVLQARLLASIRTGGPVAVDAAFDDWQRLLMARIDAL